MPGVVHLSITARRKALLTGCHSVCRSRRGEAPEGSSLFRPGVEARSAEDPGKGRRIQGIRPRQGVAHTSQSTSATPYGVAGSLAMPDPRVVGATPLDPGLKSGHPYRGATRLGDPHPWGYGGAQVSRWHDGTCKERFIHHSSR